METSKPLPSKTGLREAIDLLKRLREKKPSNELIKIVDEVTEKNEKTNDEANDRAAKKHDREVDL